MTLFYKFIPLLLPCGITGFITPRVAMGIEAQRRKAPKSGAKACDRPAEVGEGGKDRTVSMVSVMLKRWVVLRITLIFPRLEANRRRRLRRDEEAWKRKKRPSYFLWSRFS